MEIPAEPRTRFEVADPILRVTDMAARSS